MLSIKRGAVVALGVFLVGVIVGAPTVVAQNVPLDDRFVYQGELRDAGVVIDGVVDLQFTLFDQPVGGNLIGTMHTAPNVAVSRGVFQVEIPFDPFSFAGDKRHLEIAVRSPAGAGGYTTLSPRVELVPAPNAHYARFSGLAFNANEFGGTSPAGYVQKAEAGSISLGMILTDAVDSSAIVDGTILSADIAANTISNSNIAFGTIHGNKIQDNSIASTEIEDGTITAVDIAANAISGAKIADGTISAADFAAGALDGGDADTVGGLGAGQFLRSDMSDTIVGGATLTVAGGSPNSFTIGGANLELFLGDTAADQVSAPGAFTAQAAFEVLGDTTLGDSGSDTTTVNGDLNVVDGDLILSGGAGFPEITASSKLTLSAPIVSVAPGDLFLEGASSDIVFGAANTDPRISASKLTIDGPNQELILGGSSSDHTIVKGGLTAESGLHVAGGLLVTDSGIINPGGDIALGELNADQDIRFMGGSLTSNYIRWDDVVSDLSACGNGTVTQAFRWGMVSTNSSWVFENGSDVEAQISTNGDVAFDGALKTTTGCDIAETFFGPEGLEPGTVVSLDRASDEAVRPSSSSYDPMLVGVVSWHPGVLMNGGAADVYPMMDERNRLGELASRSPDDEGLQRERQALEDAIDAWPRGDVPVALAGRVMVKVVGPLAAGDPLTSSEVNGHAMVMTAPGPSIGIAMESKASNGPGSVLMLVQRGYQVPRISSSNRATARPTRKEVGGEALADLERRLKSIERTVAGRGDADGRDAIGRDGRDAVGRDGRDGQDGQGGQDDGSDRSGPIERGPIERGPIERGPSDRGEIVHLRKEAWGDFDADGRDDVFVLDPAGMGKLYRNLGDGTFRDVTSNSGLSVSGVRMAIFEDYDADRKTDLLLINNRGRASLYKGRGTGGFDDVTTAFGLDFGEPIVEAEWIDHDHDGAMDLRIATGDGQVTLHHNQGGGAFLGVELRPAMAGSAGVRAAGSDDRVAALEAELAELKALVKALANSESER